MKKKNLRPIQIWDVASSIFNKIEVAVIFLLIQVVFNFEFRYFLTMIYKKIQLGKIAWCLVLT